MPDDYFGFNVGKILVEVLKLLKKKGILEEEEILGHPLGGERPHVSLGQERN